MPNLKTSPFAKSARTGQNRLHQRRGHPDRHVLVLQSAPAYLANAQAPWQIASGVIYPEDITDDSPYLFSEIPGRFTGSYSGYNEDPLFVLVRIFPSIVVMCVDSSFGKSASLQPLWLCLPTEILVARPPRLLCNAFDKTQRAFGAIAVCTMVFAAI